MSTSLDRLYSFLETPIFMRQIEGRASIKLLFAIEDDLLKDPERGDIIQGTHGARKARIGDPDSDGESEVATGTSTHTFAAIIT